MELRFTGGSLNGSARNDPWGRAIASEAVIAVSQTSKTLEGSKMLHASQTLDEPEMLHAAQTRGCGGL